MIGLYKAQSVYEMIYLCVSHKMSVRCGNKQLSTRKIYLFSFNLSVDNWTSLQYLRSDLISRYESIFQ